MANMSRRAPFRIARRALAAIPDLLDRLVADRKTPPRPPLGNFIPNSNGEGGRVISSGDSGSN